MKVTQLKQQLNSILETTFSVGKHMIRVTGPDQQKGHRKRQRKVACGSGFITPLCTGSITEGRVSHTLGHQLLPTIWVDSILDLGCSSWFDD